MVKEININFQHILVVLMFSDLFCCGANNLLVQTQVKYIIITTLINATIFFFFL